MNSFECVARLERVMADLDLLLRRAEPVFKGQATRGELTAAQDAADVARRTLRRQPSADLRNGTVWSIQVCSDCNDPMCEAPVDPVAVKVVPLDA